jgi:Subtilase family
MKSKPIQFTASLTLAFIACGGYAAAAPGDKLPKPEDPVVLPSDTEVAQFVKNIRESELRSLKWDKDGWDDIWVMMQRAYNKDYKFDPDNKKKDTDGDGMTDYEEMLTHRNATYAEPIYTKEQQIEQVRQSRRQAIAGAIASAKEQARVRAILEPWMQGDVPSTKPGKTFSVEEEVAEKRQRMGQSLPALEKRQGDLLEAGKAAADRIGAPHRYTLPDGGDAVISGETDGIPDYQFTRNTVSADTISTDSLWPGGSLGINLTGTDFGKPSVRLGVWEPSGLVLDHAEFADTINNVDTLDAATGWTASAEGGVVLDTVAGNCQQGTGCIDLTKVAGTNATVLYSRTQPAAVNFTDRTVLVWYYSNSTATLAVTNAVQLRFGSGAGAYWFRNIDRAQLGAGWNLLSMKVPTATGVVGAPAMAACNYTAVSITYVSAATVRSGPSQGLDFWRIANTRVTNMDRAATVADHPTHVTGTMAARGNDALARGMAFTSEVHSRDSQNHLQEMAAVFSNSDATDDLFTSNHAYGPNPGWTTFRVNAATNYTFLNAATNTTQVVSIPAGNYGRWRGNITISGAEDFEFGFYNDILTGEIDRTVYSSDTLLPVWAAGNDRGDQTAVQHFETDPVLGFIFTNRVRAADGGADGYDTMPPDSVAKNILTVGSVGDLVGGWTPGSNPQPSIFSAYGPTDDGRIKPDLCANGELVYSAAYTSPYLSYNGTSQAAPSIVGSLGLLIELLQRYHGAGYQPPAALLKALMIHTADDILTVGPDYRSGYGLANAQRAAELITLSETINHGANLRTMLLQNGVQQSIPVRAIGGGVPIKATVVTTDPAGTAPANVLDPPALMLTNDFSLQITTAGAGPFNPYILNPAAPANAATTGTNTRDNVEQVLVANPVAGQIYNVLVGPAAGETFVNNLGQATPQAAVLALSGIQPDPAQEFRIVHFVQTGEAAWTLVWPAVVGCVYRVQTSTDMTTGTWTDTTGDIAPTTTHVAREVTNATPSGTRRFWRVRKVL